MRVVIVGGGKVGFYLAKTLLEHGYDVSVIEQNKELSQRCANELEAEVVCANGTTVEALEAAGADKADCLIAVMGQDESNLVCCQIAGKKFGIKKTVAKVNNPKNAKALEKLGVDIVISATDNIIQALEHEVDLSAIKRVLKLNDEEASLMEINLPANYALDGKTLMEIQIPPECNIACISRGKRIIIPRGGTTLQSGDSLLVVMKNCKEKELRKALKIKD